MKLLPQFSTLARRVRPDAEGVMRIDTRRIYILPTRYGYVFAGMVILMLIGAVNYGNNPAFLLTFLLAGLGSNTVYFTWRNLLNVRIQWIGAQPVFAGEVARFRFRLESGKSRERPAIQLNFPSQEAVAVDIPAEGPVEIDVGHFAGERGLLKPEKLIITTRYPLGLLYAWSYLAPQAETLIYPAPSGPWQPPPNPGQAGQEAGSRGRGTNDFDGLRAYRPGDQPKHIDWKAFAGERGLLTKQFGGDQEDRIYLDWQHTPGVDVENRLSRLTRAILDAEHARRTFGLRLPNQEFAPDQGRVHRDRCLSALALFGSEG